MVDRLHINEDSEKKVTESKNILIRLFFVPTCR